MHKNRRPSTKNNWVELSPPGLMVTITLIIFQQCTLYSLVGVSRLCFAGDWTGHACIYITPHGNHTVTTAIPESRTNIIGQQYTAATYGQVNCYKVTNCSMPKSPWVKTTYICKNYTQDGSTTKQHCLLLPNGRLLARLRALLRQQTKPGVAICRL